MTNTLNWEIRHCAGYVVPPCKSMDVDKAQDEIRGSSINVEETRVVREYFKPLFESVYDDCTIPIRFMANENGEQQNPIRDLIREMAFSTDNAGERPSRELALKLALATDHRSQKGLFITTAGFSPESNRYQVVVWKFPADESIQAIVEESGISIQLIQGAFSRNTKYFKAAVFRDESAQNSFWEGLVEDKQSNPEGSRFWIVEFLNAQPNLAGGYATKLLARALREIINKEVDYSIQDRVIAAATAVKSQRDSSVTFREFSETYLPPEVRERFETQIGPALLDAPFRIDEEVLDEQLGVRTVIVNTSDGRINITCPVDNLSKIIEMPNTSSLADDDESQFTFRGRIVGGKVSTSRTLK